MNELTLGLHTTVVTHRDISFAAEEDSVLNIDLNLKLAAQIHLCSDSKFVSEVKMDLFSWPLYGLYVC